MQKLFLWVKTHTLAVTLLLVILFLLTRQSVGIGPINWLSRNAGSTQYMDTMMELAPSSLPVSGGGGISAPMYYDKSSTDMSVTDRKVVIESHFAVVVKNIRDSISNISQHVESLGGFVVNTSASYPEENATGFLSVRVPAEQRENFFGFVRDAGIRVVSENISGRDVTDQFTDYQARLQTLEKTKAKFEAMMDQATTVDEILKVQQSIIQIQNQIDSITGQLKYLENTSSSSLVTIEMATDEYSLPYAPAEPWRPDVIFKQAVRSLVAMLRNFGTIGIYVLVYSPVLIVIAIGYVVGKKYFANKRSTV